MKKINKDFQEASIEVVYTQELTLAGASLDHCRIGCLKIENKSKRRWNDIAITISGAYVRPWSRVMKGQSVDAGGSVEYEGLPLDVRRDRLRALDYSVNTEIYVTVACDDVAFPVITMQAKAFPQKHFPGDQSHFDELAQFVNPDDDLVASILDKADTGRKVQEEGETFASLKEKVDAIYRAVKDRDIDYRSASFNFGKGIDIADSGDIKSRREANDLDLSLFMAACMEKAGLRSCIVCFDHHVVAGAWTDDAPSPGAPVTASPEDIYGLLDADRPLLLLVDAIGIVSGKEFEDANYSANMLMMNSNPQRLIDVTEARKAGITPLVFSKRVVRDDRDNAAAVESAVAWGSFVEKDREKGESQLSPVAHQGWDCQERKVLSMAINGNSFIINAAPQSGRTSVMSRIISDASADGKSVLYVSGDTADVSQMKDALAHRVSYAVTPEVNDCVDSIARMTDAMHRKATDGLSVYEMIDRALAIDGDKIGFTASQVRAIDHDHALSIEQDIRALDNYTKEFGCHPSKLPLAGFYPRVSTSRGQARVVAFLEEFPRFYRKVKRRERGVLNRWLGHHGAMHYLSKIEQWNTFRRLVVLDDKYLSDIDTLNEAVAQWYKYRSIIPDWMAFADEVVALGKQGASAAADYFLEGHTASESANAFLKGYYTARAKDGIVSDSALHGFKEKPATGDNAEGYNVIVDEVKTEVACDVVAAGDALPRQSYDMIIVDRADNIGSSKIADIVSRTSQLILAGDRSLLLNDNAAMAEAEKAGMPVCNMRFYYRQGHDSLFAFADREFYDNALITFPSVDRSSVVTHACCNGVYDPETGTNPNEAQAVVDHVVSIYNGTHENNAPSTCIVALSRQQASLIGELIKENDVLRPHERDGRLRVHRLEDISVHDVCDTMIFSVGFAADKTGIVPLDQLGMLKTESLNLAMTRACKGIKVFSSLLPTHLPSDNSVPEFISVLRRFIAYSTDKSTLPVDKKRVPAVVEQIKSELASRGYAVDVNVGSSDLRVNLAVEFPTGGKSYALGIIVDSKDLVDAIPDGFDREIAVPARLKDHGWKVMRVRCVDWFRDRDAVMARIADALPGL